MSPLEPKPGELALSLIGRGDFTGVKTLAYSAEVWTSVESKPPELFLLLSAAAFAHLTFREADLAICKIDAASRVLPNLSQLSETQIAALHLMEACALVDTSGASVAYDKFLSAIDDEAAIDRLLSSDEGLLPFIIPMSIATYALVCIGLRKMEQAIKQFERLQRIYQHRQSESNVISLLAEVEYRKLNGVMKDGPSKLPYITETIRIIDEMGGKSSPTILVDPIWHWLEMFDAINSQLGHFLDGVTPYSTVRLLGENGEIVRAALRQLTALVSHAPSELSYTEMNVKLAILCMWEAKYHLCIDDRPSSQSKADDASEHAGRALMSSTESNRFLRNLAAADYFRARGRHAAHAIAATSQLRDVDEVFVSCTGTIRRILELSPGDEQAMNWAFQIADDWGDVGRPQGREAERVSLYRSAVDMSGRILSALCKDNEKDAEAERFLRYIVNKSRQALQLSGRTEQVSRFLVAAVDAVAKYDLHGSSLQAAVVGLRTAEWLGGVHSYVNDKFPAMLNGDADWLTVASDYQEDAPIPRGWPNLPLIRGDWRVVKSSQIRLIVGSMRGFLNKPLLHLQSNFHVVQALRLRLAFYRDWDLLELLVESDGPDSFIIDILHNDRTNGSVVLDGQSDWVHALNSVSGLKLRDSAEAYSYAAFFSSALRGPLGRFIMLRSIQDLPGEGSFAEKIKDAALSCGEIARVENTEMFSFRTLIIYHTSLFRSEIVVGENGSVEMLNDEPLIEDLGVALESLDGAWRICSKTN